MTAPESPVGAAAGSAGSRPAAGHVPPIVVGVDGSEGGHRALLWGLREARARQCAVRVVTVWGWGGYVMSPFIAQSRARVAESATAIQREAVATALAEDAAAQPAPQPQVTTDIVEGDPATALVENASDAAMLVVGTYGHGRLHHALLGSVAEVCTRHAGCPVVVVPASEQLVLSDREATLSRRD